jgi:hypothetical protein
MPDVSIECPSCGKTITVSEFVDLSQLVCRSCGGRFTVEPEEDQEGGGNASDAEESGLLQGQPAAAFTPPPAPVVARVKTQPRRRFRWTYQLKCWAVFAGVGILAFLLRYGGILGSDALGLLIEYGPLVVLVLWLYVTFCAFRDSIMAGVLCLLVPFYALYYAFWSLEDYMFRAVYAGVLVGLGFDALIIMRDIAVRILPSIDEFLNRGM